ncbi:MAG: hypothetical protein FXF47_03095 [Candidatus Mcinerneyibacterium aminivorans]|jgi:uncharacterized membrane protein|uniref:DUF4870 domain-containing protein n=1 Tax=Candidatus Mcinerneyibacterium aminivorans TaxID=2703815 RepID=A0A5D0MEZ6_9BACT|nr:MAG: hypothetical protein FXF47_03095 [Candidatus Mcinerneyibacterium aminivorans]
MNKKDYYLYNTKDIENAGWWWGFLSYGLIFSFIPFLIYSNKNKFIYHHSKQGVMQFLFFAAGFMLLYIPKVGELFLLAYFLLHFSISFIGIILYIKKEIYEFPIIGLISRMIKISSYD